LIENLLRTSKNNSIDRIAYIGEKDRKKVRLVAVRVDGATLEKRRRERHDRDAKSKKSSSEEMKVRDEWHIMMTNIESNKTMADRTEFQGLETIRKFRIYVES